MDLAEAAGATDVWSSTRSGSWRSLPVDSGTSTRPSALPSAPSTWPRRLTQPPGSTRCTTWESACHGGRVDEARVTLRRAADEANRVGHAIAEMYIWHNLGWLELGEREFETARSRAAPRDGPQPSRSSTTTSQRRACSGWATPSSASDSTRDARAHFAAMLDLVLAAATLIPADLANAAYGIALAADPARSRDSVLLRRRVTALREREGLGSDAAGRRARGSPSPSALIGADARRWVEQRTRSMSVEEVIRLARVAR